MSNLIKIDVTYEYRDGHHRMVTYWFQSEAEIEKFRRDEKQQEHKRKIINELRYDPQ